MTVSRASGNDLMQQAVDVGPVPMNVAGILLIRPGPEWDLEAEAQALAGRLAALPRLGQRLVDAPLGCGRPYWQDVPVDVTAHVAPVAAPAPGDEAALLRVALDVMARRLPRDRPLWRLATVSGLADGRAAVVLVLDHVVADGLGGLALLQQALAPTAGSDGALRRSLSPSPTRRELLEDAWRSRLEALRALPHRVGLLRQAGRDLATRRPPTAPATSLNRPTGPRRCAAVVRLPLSDVRQVGHAHGATVNDVVLTVVVGALAALLERRGERVPHLVVSVPVAARRTGGPAGNAVGVMPVAVPALGAPVERLRAVAAMTAARRESARQSSAGVVAPVFRLLGAVGGVRWLIARQRLVNTFVSTMRGPEQQLALAGAPVESVVPVSGLAGNVGVDVTVLSYAGDLTVTVLADPDIVADVERCAADLAQEFVTLSRSTG